ncbi:MAG: SDR family oxidoreductase [Gammaproteobacteria bacterium]|nr:SDR family oxidoreductase [Gammaproteobacteria bacterium]
MTPDSSLHDRVVIITGGSRGFGRFIGEALLAAGARVVLTGATRSAQLDEVQTQADARFGPGRCVTLAADVREPEDCQRTVLAAVERFGRIDVLINNAGRGSAEYRATIDDTTTRFWDVPIAAWQRIIDTNLTGAFLMTRAVVPHMFERGFGKIFSISTSLTTMIMTGLSPYGASKAGLETAHVVWARELAPHGVDVNILLPGGASDTDFITQDMVPGTVGQRAGDGGFLLPGDIIVPPALHLCSDASNGITGRRIIAKFWDATLPAAEAFSGCLQPQHAHPEIM